MAKRPKGFYRRGKVWWWTRDPLTGKAASSGTEDLAAAKSEHARRQRLRSDPSDATAQTLDWWAVRLLRDKTENRAEGTVDFYRGKLGHALRLFGRDALPTDITPEGVDRYLETRRTEGAANTTLDKELTVIQQLCKVAKRLGAYPEDIESLRPVSFSRDYKPRERWLTQVQLMAVLRALPATRAAHVAFLVATGARWSESLRARPEHVHADRIHLLGTKTETADRWIPNLAAMRPLLQLGVPQLPFAAWGNVRRDIALACAKAGVEPVTPNDLRRTTASWCAEAGVEPSHTAKLLGHSSTKMVMQVYGRIRPDVLGGLIDAKLPLHEALHQADQAIRGDAENPKDSEGVRGRSRTADTRIFNPVFGLRATRWDYSNLASLRVDKPLSRSVLVRPITCGSWRVTTVATTPRGVRIWGSSPLTSLATVTRRHVPALGEAVAS